MEVMKVRQVSSLFPFDNDANEIQLWLTKTRGYFLIVISESSATDSLTHRIQLQLAKQNQYLDSSNPRMTEKLPQEGRGKFADPEIFPGRLKLVWSLPCYTSHCCLWMARVQLLPPAAKLLSLEAEWFLTDPRLRCIVVCVYIRDCDRCLFKDCEEQPLFTLPLSSFAKHALQKWSYKVSI